MPAAAGEDLSGLGLRTDTLASFVTQPWPRCDGAARRPELSPLLQRGPRRPAGGAHGGRPGPGAGAAPSARRDAWRRVDSTSDAPQPERGDPRTDPSQPLPLGGRSYARVMAACGRSLIVHDSTCFMPWGVAVPDKRKNINRRVRPALDDGRERAGRVPAFRRGRDCRGGGGGGGRGVLCRSRGRAYRPFDTSKKWRPGMSRTGRPPNRVVVFSRVPLVRSSVSGLGPVEP